VLAHFYFSRNSGDESQMSLDSLYRSILFECLKECPELIQEVFPRQWECFNSAVGDRLVESLEFTPTKIIEAFDILIKKSTNLVFKFCFFIDGLDEYHGETYDHWKFAERLRDWATGDDLKICASSRPHTEYVQTFLPPLTVRIQLQHLNFHDIYQFSCHTFEKDRNFLLIKAIYHDLAYEIAEKSEGVFLWAIFAVRECLTSLGYGDSPETFPERLNALPPQLDNLYERLLESVAKRDRKECDKMLCLALMDPWKEFPVRLISYLWINQLEDPIYPPPGTIPCGENEVKMHEERVEKQLDKLTKGLLEAVGDYRTGFRRVQLIHRSFREHLQSALGAGGFSLHFPASNPGEVYGKILLAESMYPPHNHFPRFQSPGVCRMAEISLKFSRYPSGSWVIPISLMKRIENKFGNSRTLFWPILHPISAQGRAERFNGFNRSSRRRQRGSFLHLAARYGYSSYLIGELKENKLLLQNEPADLSFLISAAVGGHSQLVSDLLGLGASLHRLISIPAESFEVPEGIEVPVWMAVTFAALEMCLYPQTGDSQVAQWAFLWPNIACFAGECQVNLASAPIEALWLSLSDILGPFGTSRNGSLSESYESEPNPPGNTRRLEYLRKGIFLPTMMIYRSFTILDFLDIMVW
jgi:hypothetical protein